MIVAHSHQVLFEIMFDVMLLANIERQQVMDKHKQYGKRVM